MRAGCFSIHSTDCLILDWTVWLYKLPIKLIGLVHHGIQSQYSFWRSESRTSSDGWNLRWASYWSANLARWKWIDHTRSEVWQIILIKNSSPAPNPCWRFTTCLSSHAKMSLILPIGFRCLNILSRCSENTFFECLGAQVFWNGFACFLKSREIPQIRKVSALLGFDRLDAAFVILQKNAWTVGLVLKS